MTYAQALRYLETLEPHGIRPGLDRIEALMERLRHPERRFPAALIGGTNGKGSTSRLLQSMLTAAGLRIGLYTSPHLHEVTERIQVNEVPVPREAFVQILEEVARAARGLPTPPTVFEVLTAGALLYFREVPVDLAVVEVGMGGRLDATAIVRALAAAVTNVALDHTEYLGPTIEAIAREKAEIAPTGGPLVTASADAGAIAVLREAALRKGGRLVRLGENFHVEPSPDGSFAYASAEGRFSRLKTSLRGPHQRENAAVAITLALSLRAAGIRLDRRSIVLGLRTARWPGRLEWVAGTPPVLLDGAHNPAGAEVLRRALERDPPRGRIWWVFGACRDKDLGGMLRALAPAVHRIALVPFDHPRSARPEEIRALAPDLAPRMEAFRSVGEALDRIRSAEAAPRDLMLVAGSLYLVAEARVHLGLHRPETREETEPGDLEGETPAAAAGRLPRPKGS